MSTWLKEKKIDITIKYILFLFSPFFSFLYSLRRINTKSSFLIFFITSIFFGMSFSVPSGRVEGTGGFDSQYYREKFEEYQYVSSFEFYDNLIGFLSFNEGKQDYYFDTVAFYISRITDNYHVMFMFFAIVFTYFSLKSLRFITQEEKFNTSITSYILVYLFLYNQIFNINGVRFWTAAWIAIYCIFQIYRNNNKKYYLLALLTPYFHGAFWVYLAILAIAQVFRRFEKTWIILFISSIFISTISIEFIEYFQPYLPTFLSKMVNSYTSLEAIERRSNISGLGSIFANIFKYLILFYINIIIIIFIKNAKKINQNQKTKNLYLFLLVWMSIFNFLFFVPSLGNRFITLSYPIIAYIWLVTFENKKYNYIILILPFIFLWNIREQIIHYSMVLTLDFYISNPFYLIYKYIFI